MAPLSVDPEALSGAGGVVAAVGSVLGASVGALTAGYGANTGQDAAGEVFGLAYQDAAESLLKAAAAGINACGRVGFRVQVSASNYSRAEAASTLGGGGATLPTPAEPEGFSAPGAPGTLGPGVPAPALWALVEAFVGDLWPNGDPAGLHTAAGFWRAFGAALDGATDELAGPKSVVGSQQIPEGDQIQQALSRLGTDMAGIGAQCAKLAGALDGFADEVAHAQKAIRDLLHRLGSASGLFHEMVQVFKGHGLDEVKRIANDIKVVLQHVKREAQAREHLLRDGMQMLDGLVRGLETYARGEITHFVGEDVGNPLATVFDTYVNVGEGLLKDVVGGEQELEQLNPLRFAYDPKGAAATWEGAAKGLAETLLSGDPATAPLVDALDPQFCSNLGKQLLHADDWRGDRPGLGAGENLGDILTLLTGAGEVGAASKATEAAGAAGRAELEAGLVGRGGRAAGELGEVAGSSGALSDISATTGDLTKNLDQVGSDLSKDPVGGGRPVGLPPTRPLESPVEPTPGAVESAPGAEPQAHPPEPASAPAEPTTPAGVGDQPAPGTREPASVPSTGQHPAPEVAARGEHLPSSTPAAEPVPTRMPASAGSPPEPAPASVPASSPPGSPAMPAPAATHSAPAPASPTSAPAAAQAPAPYSAPAGGHPSEPTTHGTGRGPCDSGDPGGSAGHDPRAGDLDGGDSDHHRSDAGDYGDQHEPPKARDVFPNAKPYGDLTKEEYEKEFLDTDGHLRYPDEDDPAKPYAIPGTDHELTDAEIMKLDGKIVDRIGHPGGKWLAPDGTPYEGRSLPHESLDKGIYRYLIHAEKGLPPGWRIEESRAAPWFGHHGEEPQFKLIAPPGARARAQDLIDRGFLEDVCDGKG